MTIVEGQIEPLKKLKEALSRSGITRFNSIGEIDRFIKNYEAEKQQLPGLIESALEAEIQTMQAALTRHQQIYEELKAGIRNEITQKAQELEVETRKAKDKSKRNLFYGILYFLKIKNLSRRKSNIEKNLESIIKKKTSNAEDKVAKLKIEIADCLENKGKIISERCKKSFEDMAYMKEVIEGLYTLIAGAIGESSVVNVLQQLSDDCYLFNDFSLNFDPPIYNKNEDDRIFSIQIDHLLVCQSGVFLLVYWFSLKWTNTFYA
ncbi:MAG TPA: NERD domain-containing protein [Anaerohalosphaeraceae bacterium]|nr:NERD domain-containing protein [Anaerohalosphaeraceae bacterium]